MNPHDPPLTPEQREALLALEKHTGEWGALSRGLEEMLPAACRAERSVSMPNAEPTQAPRLAAPSLPGNEEPHLTTSNIARLENTRLQALADASKQGIAPRASVFQPQAAPAPRRSFIAQHSSRIIRLAAALALLATLSYFIISPSSSNADIAILSPRGEIPTTHPVIAWKAQPGKSYDVWILPPQGDVLTAPALFKAEKVRPPVDFAVLKPGKDQPLLAALTPGEDYRILVCYADTKRVGGIAIPFYVQLQPAANP